MAATIITGHRDSAVAWCHLNAEGDLLERLIPGAVQVAGDDPDEVKEEQFRAFESGQARVMVTKPTIAGFGLNWQHCANQTFFPSHSYEQWYQAVRRSWRFGQKRAVRVDVISSEGEADVLRNLQRKDDAAARMFDQLVAHMRDELRIETKNEHLREMRIPEWLS